ncbi:unnamed protein product [Hydatigera taeniaeformis]|uniref:AA_permease domain-containing protein n=1 Tax=Hydatigena taeniaeformis TaxID=6205 RepID=A0A0R3WPQ0_HYDTA|nr:unnamed protein product [Hydatigera taeniaeformis]
MRVLGANVFGVGIYVAYELKFMPAYEAESAPMVAIVVVVSAALIIISLIGCIGALLRKPWMLGVFSLVTTILALIEIGLYLTVVLLANEANETELSKIILDYAAPVGICVNLLAALQIFSGGLACAVVLGI